MSGSKAKLEQILELLLSEETERAEELLHEYVVAKARAEYEKVLEADEDELESSEDEIMGDEEGDVEMDGDMDLGDDEGDEFEMDDADDMGGEEESPEAEEEDLEDKVDSLEDELEQLRAEFEELMSQEEGESEHGDMDMGGEEHDMEFDMAKEGVAEATQFSKPASVQPMKGASMKGSEADGSNGKSPFSSKPKATTVAGAGSPVKSHDGGEGKHNHGGSVKDHTPTDNMGIEPKKASAPSKPE